MSRHSTKPLPGSAILLRALFKAARPVVDGATFTTYYEAPGVSADALARYNALLGFPPGALPISYYYLPTQRAHLGTMLQAEFPFRLAGMIHVENDIRELRQADIGMPILLATEVHIEAPAPNGARYCELRTVGTQLGGPVFECRSRYLAIRGERRPGGEPRHAPALPGGAAVGEWSLAPDAGRRYAVVSGDWNPIHLWRWSARLFGLKMPIIHGMHTVGRTCALLEQAYGRRLTSVSARFRTPVVLGRSVTLHADAASGEYCLVCDNHAAMTGVIESN